MNILTFFRKPYLSVFLALTIILSSCSNGYEDVELGSNNENIKSNTTFARTTTYTGEELFRGIYFGANIDLPLKHVTELNNYRKTLSAELNSQLDTYANLVVTKIKSNDKDFFENFKNKITSNDHYIIESVLDESATMLNSIVYDIPEIRDELLLTERIAGEVDLTMFVDENGNFNQNDFQDYIEINYPNETNAIITPTFIGVWLVAALVQTVVVAVNYYFGVFVKTKFWGPSKIQSSNNMSHLQREILINEIYEKL